MYHDQRVYFLHPGINSSDEPAQPDVEECGKYIIHMLIEFISILRIHRTFAR